MNLQNFYFLLFIALVGSTKLLSQESTTRENFIYNIKRTSSLIKIDGIESEGEWNNTQLIDTLYNHNPSDVGISKNGSEIRLAYDDEKLYIFAKHFDEGKRIVQSLQRDSDNSQWGSDSFTIAIDPINKKQSGIIIGVNAGGAELDGNLLIQPSRTTYSDEKDQRWISSTKQYDDYWLTEFAIPLSSLRYDENNLQWGINFIRGDKVENYYYTWTTPFPINFNGIDVNYMGTLQWDAIPKVKNKIAYIKPYTTLSSLKDNEIENKETEYKIDAGVDIKIGITKSFNADITLNPDFSNADVDEEVTNITRFDISLPEQREFFLENADIFSNFGSYTVIPFFSRQIGLDAPIIYGVRASGNLTNNLRLGVMNVQTKKEDEIDAQNNTVVAFNYKVLNRSQLKGLFINRQETSNSEINDYTRNYGGEFTYISKKGNFNNNVKFHSSVTDENSKGYYLGIQGNYMTRTFGSGWTLDKVDKDYQADLGFTPRIFNYNAEIDTTIREGYTLINPWLRYTLYTKNKESKIISHSLRTWNDFYLDEDNEFYERANNIAYDLALKNTSSFSLSGSNREVDLKYPTNFLGEEFDNLPVQNYNFSNGSLSYNSDKRKQLTYRTSATLGGFFNGNITAFSVMGNIRFGYWGNFSISYDYNDITLPENYGDVNLHLLKFKALISFTNKLFFNNTVQYNSQSENFSVFSKLQWRYSSLSDIFLIYNQNNDTNGFDLSNKSIILKITYQFGV